MSKRRKEIFTRIDYKLYKKIKEKGYTFSELIELGYEYKEGKQVTTETLKSFLNDLRKTNEEIREVIKPLKSIIKDLEDLEKIINISRSRISSKIFPSKYETLNILSEIEKKIKDIKSKIY